MLLGPRELIESFELMAEMEATCGRLAAQRMGEDDQRAIRAAHEECRAAALAEDLSAYYEANTHFHGAV